MLHAFFKAAAAVALLLPVGCLQAQITTPQSSQGQAIRWEVTQRFPLLRSGAALQGALRLRRGQSLQDWSRDVLAANSNLLESFTKAYTHEHGKGCAQSIAAKDFPTLWNPCTERYDDKLFERGPYEILVELTAAPPGRCKFSAGAEEKVAGCAEKVVLKVSSPDIAYPLSVEAVDGGFRAVGEARIQDILLVAFGDSFSSGESNPDVPALHKDGPVTQGDGQLLSGVRWIDSPHRLERRAAWLDSRCHRSLFSWPVLAAARLAVENPHMVVRVASWACSGAEITDGFYSPQLRDGALRQSQFMSARMVVCKNKDGSGPPFETVERLGDGGGLVTGKKGSTVKGCAAADRSHRVDAAMFTFGGNDIFFAPVLMDAVMMTGTRYVPGFDLLYKPLRKGVVKRPEDAKKRIDGKVENPYDRLAVRYASLQAGLNALGIAPERVFQVQYPNPLHDTHTKICDISPDDGMDVVEKLQRVANLTEDESQRAERLVIGPLTQRIKDNPHGWKIVDAHVEKMATHGLCAFNTDRAKEFAMPRLAAGTWVNGFKPSDYQHYRDTARWFRTPDDVAMGMYEGSSLLPIQGAFHPSARAHAVIADEVYEALKKTFVLPDAP